MWSGGQVWLKHADEEKLFAGRYINYFRLTRTGV
jgi:hypothetical protein